MAERWVVNASPLIVLAKVGHAHLLSALTDEIVVPQTVVDEINAGPADDPARAWLSDNPLPVVAISRAPAELLAWDLGAGETAVMAYALANSGWTAVLDDNAARKCARSFGFR
jgi:predicted nucleic acid-binding protein